MMFDDSISSCTLLLFNTFTSTHMHSLGLVLLSWGRLHRAAETGTGTVCLHPLSCKDSLLPMLSQLT